MSQLTRRFKRWLSRDRVSAESMSLGAPRGTSDVDLDRDSRATNVFGSLSNTEVEARITAAQARLAHLEAFEKTDSVPMGQLTDPQLEVRILFVEEALAQLDQEAFGKAATHRADPDPSAAAVERHIAALDFLLEHPDAAIPPLWALDDDPNPNR